MEDKYVNVEKECIPATVNSEAAWVSNPFKHALPLLEAQLFIIIGFDLLLFFILKRLGFPQLVSHMIAGLLLSLTFHKLHEIGCKPLTLQSEKILGTLTEFGYMLFLFIVGVKMDMKMVLKTGKKAFSVGVIALIAPLVTGMLLQGPLMKKFIPNADEKRKSATQNLAFAQSLTTFPVISCLLNELGIINSELGRLALSSAIISESLSLFLIAIVMSIKNRKANKGTPGTLIDPVLFVLYVLFMVFVARRLMFWVIKQTPEGRPVRSIYIKVIMSMVLVSAMITHSFNQFVLLGPYIFGLVTPDGPPLGSMLVEKFEGFPSNFLMPVFITICASKVRLSLIPEKHKEMYVDVILFIATSTSKVVACSLCTWISGMPYRDCFALALIMSAQGIVELATITFSRDAGTLPEESFVVAVIATMLVAFIIPNIVKRVYDSSRKYAGYQKRNISHLRPNEELRVLVCIHKPYNTAAVIKLLDATSPTRERPIAAYVLHVIELVGRTSPIFISHQFQTRTVSDHSYSEQVIRAFNQYEESRDDAVSVQTFTALSPSRLMNEDIGNLALNKLTSLIIMPFHRKWAIDGSIEAENSNLRSLNCSILDRAPCSVAILIDRGRLVRSTSLAGSPNTYCKVAMMFIGGCDDREGLLYAKRMARGSNISLTVIRFVARDREETRQWERIMDQEALKEVELSQMEDEYGGIGLREETVEDGPETALIVRSMVDDYDMIIVGRRYNIESPQTSGLKVWSEFPELGILGDLLASPDLESKTPVLVIQQQRVAA